MDRGSSFYPKAQCFMCKLICGPIFLNNRQRSKQYPTNLLFYVPFRKGNRTPELIDEATLGGHLYLCLLNLHGFNNSTATARSEIGVFLLKELFTLSPSLSTIINLFFC